MVKPLTVRRTVHPPDPWDMTVRPPTRFKDDWTIREIPHTAYVKMCFRCDGDGKVECYSCSGSGTTSCGSCSGSGKNSDDETCSSCSGSGTESCSSCYGSGKQECSTCDGYGKLKHYRQLIINWKNHIDHFISDSMRLPSDLIIDVSGREIFKEEYPQIQPITHSPDSTVNDASAHLINTHKTAFPVELVTVNAEAYTVGCSSNERNLHLEKEARRILCLRISKESLLRKLPTEMLLLHMLLKKLLSPKKISPKTVVAKKISPKTAVAKIISPKTVVAKKCSPKTNL